MSPAHPVNIFHAVQSEHIYIYIIGLCVVTDTVWFGFVQ